MQQYILCSFCMRECRMSGCKKIQHPIYNLGNILYNILVDILET